MFKTNRRAACTKHVWSSEVRWNRVKCENCPKEIKVTKLDQMRKMAATKKMIAAIRKEQA